MPVSFPILTNADFTGEFNIVLNSFQETVFDDFCATFEKKYVREIFSDEMYAALVAGTSETQYTELINGIQYTDSEGKICINDGFKKVLKYFIKSQWLKNNFTESVVGMSKNTNENSESASNGMNANIVYSVFNKGVNLYLTDILKFVYEKHNTIGYEAYDDFKLPFYDFCLL